MAHQELKVHRLGLGRIVVEGSLQPIVRFATLTLKDEDHHKQIMQLHVDGDRLAQWDLAMLRERKLTGGEKFFTIAEQKMLQFTLPLFEEDGQKVASIKTIQLFVLDIKDFQTAINYLSRGAGMLHCQLNRVLQNLKDVSLPKPAPSSKPEESSGNSDMGPPTVPPMGRLMRPQSQTSVHVPLGYTLSQHFHRSQTARPNMKLAPGDASQNTSTPGNFVPMHERSLSQGHSYWSSPLIGPPDPRSSFSQGDSSHPQRLLSTGPGVGVVGERKPLYEHPSHGASVGRHTPSYPLQHNAWTPQPSPHQVERGTGNMPNGPYHGRFHGQPASQSGRISASTPRTVSIGTYPVQGCPTSRPPTARPASRPSPVSDHGVPIKIQVVGLHDESSYSGFHPKIRWEFTLHLVPSTKLLELCLHAASYIRREYRATVDGRALVAQKLDGTLFEDQDSLSDEILQGETLLLVERGGINTDRPAPVKSDRSYPEPLYPDLRPEASKLDGAHPTSSQGPFPRVIDEADSVPPPRQLPFRLVPKPAPPRSSSSATVAQSPLGEMPDLMNTRSRAKKRSAQPVTPNISTEPEAAAKKQANSNRNRPNTTTRRSPSSARGNRLDSVSGTVEPSEPRKSARRPETSLGIRHKREAPPGDGGVSSATPPVLGSLQSDIDASEKEVATTACMGCRRKKRKCDRSKPACGPCLKDKRPCIYPNMQKATTTDQTSEAAHNEPALDIVAEPMILRSQVRSQSLTAPPVVSDALTQTCHPREYRDIGAQTQENEQGDSVEMKDAGIDPCNLYTDASTEMDRCDEISSAFSQCTQVVLWANHRYETQVQKAAEILSTTDPTHVDYKEKLAQAAVYAWEFETDFRERYEQALKT